jgi:hypothetical protein
MCILIGKPHNVDNFVQKYLTNNADNTNNLFIIVVWKGDNLNQSPRHNEIW